MAWGCSTSDNASEKWQEDGECQFRKQLLESSGPPAKDLLYFYAARVPSFSVKHWVSQMVTLALTSAGWGMSQKRGETRLLVKLYSCVGVTVQSSG